jgi:Lar family restriction alleviation protein
MIVETEVTLEACPFCGQPGILKINNDGRKGGGQYWVKCSTNGCGASPASAPTIEQAIERWNTRA